MRQTWLQMASANRQCKMTSDRIVSYVAVPTALDAYFGQPTVRSCLLVCCMLLLLLGDSRS